MLPLRVKVEWVCRANVTSREGEHSRGTAGALDSHLASRLHACFLIHEMGSLGVSILQDSREDEMRQCMENAFALSLAYASVSQVLARHLQGIRETLHGLGLGLEG